MDAFDFNNMDFSKMTQSDYSKAYATSAPPILSSFRFLIPFLINPFRTLAILSAIYAFTRISAVRTSISILLQGVKLKRIFIEDKGVEGCSWFAKQRTNVWRHFFANCLRVIIVLFCSPLLLLPPQFNDVFNFIKSLWMVEIAYPFDGLLSKSPGDGRPALYEPTGYKPRWLLRVEFRPDNQLPVYEQVPWSEDVRATGYTALSYPVESAFQLFKDADRRLNDPSPFSKGHQWSLRDRLKIAEQLLFEYARAKGNISVSEYEYIWLDEFCLSNRSLTDPKVIRERNLELGRIADIFRGATRVCVFCHEHDCDHTSLKCPWGTRVFTLAEILHAKKVVRMTRSSKRTGTVQSYLHPEQANSFRRAIQNKAEAGEQWHLHAVIQRVIEAGAIYDQASIHALVVEVIRRDEASNFRQHQFLGKALNGLLPRRARIADIRGNDGWSDLAWLLELNQGSYNAASLAAICSLSGGDATRDATSNVTESVINIPIRHPWLGKPVLPTPGTERLDPIVTAIPVRNPASRDSSSALSIVGPKTIVVHSMPRRDPDAFHRNDDMAGLRILSLALFSFALWYNMEFVLSRSQDLKAARNLFWITCVIHGMTKLAVGTMYLKREGWVYLSASQWGKDPRKKLSAQDHRFKNLAHWGDPEHQAVPEWHAASDSHLGTLVDFRNRVYTNAFMTRCPNAMVPLAIHGSGITCTLLDRPENSTMGSERVGMVNLPTYIHVQATRTASVCVNGQAEAVAMSGWLRFWLDCGEALMMVVRYCRAKDASSASSGNAVPVQSHSTAHDSVKED